MKTTIYLDVPQKHNDYQPDSLTLDTESLDGSSFVDVTVHSEEEKTDVTTTLPLNELYFAVKGFYDYAQAEEVADHARSI